MTVTSHGMFFIAGAKKRVGEVHKLSFRSSLVIFSGSNLWFSYTIFMVL